MLNVGSWYSFRYVANLFKQFLLEHYNVNAEISYKYKEGYTNILIEDTWNCLIRGDKADIYWTDTANPVARFQTFYLKRIEKNKDRVFRYNYAVSNSNKKLMEKFGIRVNGVIPRLVNSKYFTYNGYSDKKYDIIFIGNLDKCDRKNVRLALDTAIELKLKSVFVIPKLPTYYRHIPSYIKIIQYGSLTDEQKADLISKSKYLLWLSFYEGFGMPVLESMALGVPIIYSNVPAHNEFAVGFYIDPKVEYITACYGTWVKKSSFSIEDVKRVTLNALNVSKDEYQDLCEKARDKAVEIYNKFVYNVDKLLV